MVILLNKTFLRSFIICLVILTFAVPTLAATTQLHIVKYANDGTTILNETTKTYQWLEGNLPVLGDGTTHYYHQGPVFVDDPDEATEQLLRWNPEEDTNVLEKDMGAVKGTNLRHICDLVGGMNSGETVRVKASDGLYKTFAYQNVYGYSSHEGPIVVTWYCAGLPSYSGLYPDTGYSDGMRLVWFADTSVNPWGEHVFGNFDWYESAAPEYWYYYVSGSEQYPTTTGLSVKYISDVLIYSDDPSPTPPVAAFSGTPRSGTAPLTVTFTDASTGTAPRTYVWDFQNDGSVDSTLQNPSYQYTAAGTYTVKLTVTNTAGSDSEVKTGYITVSVAPVAPVAAFSGTPRSGAAPLTVTFTDASTGTAPLVYAWDFQNDGSVDSTLQNPSYQYAATGTYTVKLTVTNAAGSDSEVKTGYITVSAAPVAPVAAFSATPRSGTAPLTVSFTDSSTGTGPLTYAWDFRNDGSVDSTLQNPSYQYAATGTYTVKLTVTNTAGSDSEIKSGYITASTTPIVTNVTSNIGIFRPSSGIWSLDTNGNNIWEPSDKSLSWGLPNDVPVIGDWNGDGKEGIGIFRPSSGIWSLDSNENFAWEPSDKSLSWGLPNDVPIIGDWNGDNKDDIGIFRPGSGIWSLDSNGNIVWEVSDKSLSWGLPNDKSVVGKY